MLSTLTAILLAAPPAGVPTVDVDDPAECAGCHATIVGEWRQSMHAHAHHSRDPLYAAMRAQRMKAEGPEVALACAKCHTPRAAPGDVEGGLRGVTCAACHNVAAVHDKGVGRDRLRWAPPGTVFGPHDVDPTAAPMHLTGKSPPHFADGATLCLACHEQLSNGAGIALCATGLEWKGFGVGGCTTCHMPPVETPNGTADRDALHPDHRFVGPRGSRQGTIRLSALGLQANFDGEEIVVNLINHAGHALPSGFPGRLVQVVIDGEGADGITHWRLPADATAALLGRRFLDADGRPTTPAAAVTVGPDTRLMPGEVRTVRFKVPLTVHAADVRVVHHPMPPKMKAALGLEGEARANPRLLGRLRISR